MANDGNLLPQSKRTKSEQREIARKGGKRSGEVRREKRRLRDIVRTMLEADSAEMPGLSVAEAITASMIESAMNGDVKAYVALRDTAGEKPVDKQQTEHAGEISFSWAKTPPKDADAD